MSHDGALRGRTCSRGIRPRSRARRPAVLFTAGVLTLASLAGLTGCGSGDEEQGPARPVPRDIAAAGRAGVGDGGSLRWAVDSVPSTLNAFQADADATTGRVAQAVLPSMFTLDERGRPQANPAYLESAEVVEREPKQVVLYKLHQQAVWSDGREIGAPDFVAQWRALAGKDSKYWTARNAGYERIEKIERGDGDLQVRVTFAKPYADWRALFSPLYPKDVTGTPDAFNEGARTQLKNTAGPFRVKAVDAKSAAVTLERNPRWWGSPAKLDTLVLSAVPRGRRPAALAAGTLDLAEVDTAGAERITRAHQDAGTAGGQPLTHGPGADTTPSAALKSWALAYGSDEEQAEVHQAARLRARQAVTAYAAQQKALRGFAVRKSLEPAYTQLAMNGESGPLADERVRRAVARALDRRELAETVLKPLGLPAHPVGSHLALAGQGAYADGSGALGGQDTEEALGLLADAGWTRGGARKPAAPKDAAGQPAERENGKEKKSEGEESKDAAKAGTGGVNGAASPEAAGRAPAEKSAADEPSNEGLYIVGDDKPAAEAGGGADGTRVLAPAAHGIKLPADAEKAAPEKAVPEKAVPGAYAPMGTAAPAAKGSASPAAGASAAAPASGPLAKDGRPLTLRFVLPAGPGSEALRTVGEKIVRMLDKVGITTEITKVPDESYFKDHIAAGDYDLALYSWPGTAYPATDGRPIYAKPRPAADGSLLVEQNYTRVGTDHIDQLFDQAAAELDEKAGNELVRQADARIWATAGSIPLYQRPQLVAARANVANAGAFGFATPRFEDIGFSGKGSR
ncbi:ABC transporter family substrate-binding protein [Streptomyces sp. NPDC047097]|uniref:ABC transporter family substrate-binding protein n=1 Tax=Streptomyces sp. NPDC047097 TaxID=3155260 RepID=UPI0033C68200